MEFNEYQKRSRKTAIYETIGEPIVYPTLGLAGESGEVVEKIKKVLRNKRGGFSKEDKEMLMKELGDVLWYVAQIATELEIELDMVAKQNVEKLEDRMNRNVLHSNGDDR